MNPSMTGAGCTNFMTPLKNSMRTGRALRMYPAQSILFEVGAICIFECMNVSSRSHSTSRQLFSS
jgi:hypothetical protein